MAPFGRSAFALHNGLKSLVASLALAAVLAGGLPDMAQASGGGGHGGGESKPAKKAGPDEPQLPETVLTPDAISLTVMLPSTATIRQMVFHIWLEAATPEDRETIERAEPVLLNAFLRDLQQLMYRDTQNRYEKLAEGSRSFRYDGPDLRKMPPPKTPEQLEAEKAKIEAAKESGEEVKTDPPFSPFRPPTNRYFAILQNRLLAVAQTIVPANSIRSVQIRKFYDNWPGEKPRTR